MDLKELESRQTLSSIQDEFGIEVFHKALMIHVGNNDYNRDNLIKLCIEFYFDKLLENIC